MHIPDGFINGATSAGAGIAAMGGLGGALASAGRQMKDRLIPLAGLAAAFVFVLQMLNFPVAAGTSGHLLGGALGVILLGPALGITVISVVVLVQALLFADGGITALGLNILNMAIIGGAVAWLVFRGVCRVLPKRSSTVLVATLAAAWTSVVVASVGFSLEYAIGGHGGVSPGTVFGAMTGVHALIGIGEGLISLAVVGAVMASRPDLVEGARIVGIDVAGGETRLGGRAIWSFVVAGVVAALVLVMFVAPNASSSPDGLEKVAIDQGFEGLAEEHPIGGPLADYGVSGIKNETLGTILAGAVGMVVTFGLGMIAAGTIRRRRPQEA